ncbi:MAG: PKD domain-containing protein [Bacteroidota bacterium]
MRIYLIYIFILIFLPVQLVHCQTCNTKSLGFNTDFSEFGPAFYKNGIVFCSDRKNNYVVITDEQGESYLSDIYISIPDSTGNRYKTEIFSQELTSIYNEGPLCFSDNYSVVYFTRSQEVFKKVKDIARKKNNLGIFTAELVDNKYTNIQPLEFIKKEFNYAHPSISADGNFLYFTSNMMNGYGGSDIYVCSKTPSGWSSPQNLGKNINTSGMEMFPFIHQNGRLYFSSDKPNGFGGLDIYYSVKTASGWSKPVALDTNINSSFDDFGFICDASTDSGYFCSNKNGSDDIFAFKIDYPPFSECDSLKYAVLCYDLYEENAILSDSLPLEYEWDMGDGTKYRGAKISHCYTKPDLYIVKLNVINTISGEIFKNDATYELFIEEIKRPEILVPDTVIVGNTIYINSSVVRLKDISDVKYYWDMGDGTKTIGESVTYKYEMEGIYNIELGIIGTNSYGETERNCVYKSIVVLAEN